VGGGAGGGGGGGGFVGGGCGWGGGGGGTAHERHGNFYRFGTNGMNPVSDKGWDQRSSGNDYAHGSASRTTQLCGQTNF